MATRPKDELWEALVAACGADSTQMTKSERGRYNHALKELRDVSATPDDIHIRSNRYKQKYPNIDLTPTALTAHWSALRPPSRVTGNRERLVIVDDSVPVHPPCSMHRVPGCNECAARARDEFMAMLKEARLGALPDD